jgi:hypothetical protein
MVRHEDTPITFAAIAHCRVQGRGKRSTTIASYFPVFSGKLNFAPSMCRAADARLQQERPTENHPLRPTPRTIIEAIMFCVRERGPQALHEPGNIERLSRCDNAAIAEIDARIRKLKSSHAP